MNGPDPWAAMPTADGEGAVNCNLYLPFFPLPFCLLISLSVCPATVCQLASSGFQAASELAEVVSWFNPSHAGTRSLPPVGMGERTGREEKLMS